MLKQRGRSCGGLVDKSLSAKARQPFALGYMRQRRPPAVHAGPDEAAASSNATAELTARVQKQKATARTNPARRDCRKRPVASLGVRRCAPLL
jgi:hypothetical protein